MTAAPALHWTKRHIMSHSTFKSAIAVGLLTAAACAHAPPKELVDARAAYKRAADGIASQQTPAQLHTAETALKQAELTFEEDGDTEHARDLAYVALRKAQRAEKEAEVMQSEQTLAQLEADKTQSQGEELSMLRGQSAQQQLQITASETARKDSDRRADQATADLARIATVKQEPRGMVIVLSGSLLFTSGKTELRPAAQAKLSAVADALIQQNPDATIIVEGHTDTQGSEAINLDLSTRRAEVVRDYLAAHGVAPDRIRAEGFGFSRPIADNKTAEGRANNRRVEIVVPSAPSPR